MELILDRHQKKIWAGLEAKFVQAWKLMGSLLADCESALDVVPAESLMVESTVKASDPDDPVVETFARGAYESLTTRAACVGRRRRGPTMILPLPREEVVFSLGGQNVRLPHLGLVRCRPNMFFLPGPGGSMAGVKARLHAEARFYLARINQREFLLARAEAPQDGT